MEKNQLLSKQEKHLIFKWLSSLPNKYRSSSYWKAERAVIIHLPMIDNIDNDDVMNTGIWLVLRTRRGSLDIKLVNLDCNKFISSGMSYSWVAWDVLRQQLPKIMQSFEVK